MFFVYSESHSTSELNAIDFYEGIFLHAIPVRIIVPWLYQRKKFDTIQENKLRDVPLCGTVIRKDLFGKKNLPV